MKSLIGATTVLVLLVAVPIPTVHAAPTRYEAENAACDGTIDSNHSGFSGTGFCNSTNTTGAAVQFTVNAASAGTATLGIRYASGGTTDRPATVNGGATPSFPSTGAWNTWNTATTTIQVNASANTIRFAATTNRTTSTTSGAPA